MAGTKRCGSCGRVTQWISWSRLRSHEECHQKGYLERARKRAPLANTRVFFPGNVTDRAVRDFLLLPDPYEHEGWMAAHVEDIVTREKKIIEDDGGVMSWKDRADKAQVIKDCTEAVTKIEAGLWEKVLPYEYRPDFRFKAPISIPHPNGGTEEVIINGAMDIVGRNPETNEWFVWDVKHTRDNSYWKKTQGQLGFYDLAIQLMFKAKTSEVGLLQPLCTERIKAVPLDSNTRSVMMQRIMRMAQEVWRDEKTPRSDSKYCGFCDVKHACSKFKAVEVNGRRTVSLGMPKIDVEDA